MDKQSKQGNSSLLLILVLILTVLLPAGVNASESAPERPLEKVTIAYSSLSGNMAPLWITHERGFFRKYGLDVQLVFIESGTTTVQSLISKDVYFAQMAGAAVIQSRLRGADVVMIAGVMNTLNFKLYVDKSIKQPDQLKGKIVAVTRFGSSTDFALRYALERYGLGARKRGHDRAGRQHAGDPCLARNRKDPGAMFISAFYAKSKKHGLPLMADLQMLGLEYHTRFGDYSGIHQGPA
jgi:hypothetical protein